MMQVMQMKTVMTFDRDDMEEKLEEMSYKELKAFIKENGLQPETKLKKKTFDDDQEDIIEEILDELEERAEEGDDKPAGKAKAPETKKDAPKKGAPQRKKRCGNR
jgi:low affinity Fe/Cu permease